MYSNLIFYSDCVCISCMHTISPTFSHKANNTNSMTSATLQTNIQCRRNCVPSPSTDSQTLVTCKSVENYLVPLAALGGLLGLSLLLLAVVITGWVCTCRSMRKKEARKNSKHTRYVFLKGRGVTVAIL